MLVPMSVIDLSSARMVAQNTARRSAIQDRAPILARKLAPRIIPVPEEIQLSGIDSVPDFMPDEKVQ